MTELLTDEEYEIESRWWDERKRKRKEEQELSGRLESPEE
jgi:hypothetical protein